MTRWIGAERARRDRRAALSPDGRWVVSRGDDGALRLTRTSTGATRVVAAQGQLGARPFSADGRLLALVSDASVVLHDTRTGTAVPLPVPEGGFPLRTALSGDGRLAAYAWSRRTAPRPDVPRRGAARPVSPGPSSARWTRAAGPVARARLER